MKVIAMLFFKNQGYQTWQNLKIQRVARYT
jgi:hypothetical protein